MMRKRLFKNPSFAQLCSLLVCSSQLPVLHTKNSKILLGDLPWLTYPMLVLRDGDFGELKPSDVMRASYVENNHIGYFWVQSYRVASHQLRTFVYRLKSFFASEQLLETGTRGHQQVFH